MTKFRQMTVIHPDGMREWHKVEKAREHAGIKCDVLRKAVGGILQIVPHFTKYEGKRCTAYVHEEGLLIGLPFNKAATDLWLEQLGRGPFSYKPRLVGPLVIDQPLPAHLDMGEGI